jgi:hypothetical protein
MNHCFFADNDRTGAAFNGTFNMAAQKLCTFKYKVSFQDRLRS